MIEETLSMPNNARHYVVLYFARGYLATRRAS